MPVKLFNHDTGKWELQDEDGALQALRSGRFALPKGRGLVMIDGAGTRFVVNNTAEAYRAAQSPVRIESEKDRARDRLKGTVFEGDVAQTAAAAVAGAADGVSYGIGTPLATLAAEAAGVDDAAQITGDLMSASPAAHGIGYGVGIGASVLAGSRAATKGPAAGGLIQRGFANLPVGLGARLTSQAEAKIAGKIASKAVRAAAKGPAVVAKMAATPAGQKTAQVAGQIIGAATQAGIEGALWGTGQALSEAVLEDKELTAEGVLSSALAGGATGLVTGAALSGAFQGVRGVFRKVRPGKGASVELLESHWGDELTEQAKQSLKDRVGRKAVRGFGKMSDFWRGTDEAADIMDEVMKRPNWTDDIRVNKEIASDAWAAKWARAAKEADEASAPLGRKLSERKQALLDELIPGDIKALNKLDIPTTPQTFAATRELFDNMRNRFRGITPQDYKQIPRVKSAFRKLEALKAQHVLESGGQGANAKMFKELDSFRNQIDDMIDAIRPKSKRAVPSEELQNTIDLLQDLRTDVAQHLRRDDVYGSKAAELYRRYTDAWASEKNVSPAMSKFFGSVREDGWQTVWEHDPAKWKSLGRDVLGTDNLSARGVGDFYNARISRLREMKEILKPDAATVKEIDKAIAKHENFLGLYKRGSEQLKTVHQQGILDRSMGGLGSFVMLGGVGAGLGTALTDDGSGAAMGAAAGMALGALGAPGRMFRLLASAKTLSGKATNRVKRAGGELVRQQGREAIRQATVPAVIDARDRRAKEKRDLDTLSATIDGLRDVITNPELLRTSIDNVVGDLASFAPETAAAMSAKLATITYGLWDHATRLGLTEEQYALLPQHSRMKVLQFRRIQEAALNPLATIDSFAAGVATDLEVDVLQQMWPRLHGELVASVVEELSKSKLPPTSHQRRRLSTLLNVPMDPLSTPDGIAFLQAFHRAGDGGAEFGQLGGRPAQPQQNISPTELEMKYNMNSTKASQLANRSPA